MRETINARKQFAIVKSAQEELNNRLKVAAEREKEKIPIRINSRTILMIHPSEVENVKKKYNLT